MIRNSLASRKAFSIYVRLFTIIPRARQSDPVSETVNTLSLTYTTSRVKSVVYEFMGDNPGRS